MRLWTWEEMKTKVENDLDMQGEETVSPAEMLGYANEAIDEAEAEIHNLAEDYFFTKDKMPLILGESVYGMPGDIYASKIRGLFYDDGVSRYAIRRIRKERLDTIASILPADPYVYLETNLINDGVNPTPGPKIEIFPPSRVTSATAVTRYYLRNAKRLVNLTDECDIPEFVSFVISYVKVHCAAKEQHPRLDFFVNELERTRLKMTETLTEMTPDGDSVIEGDMSLYDDHN